MATFDVNSTGKDVATALGSRLEGKTVVLTGPSPGSLGAQLIVDLASVLKQAHLILAGRNSAKLAPVIDEIRAASPSVTVSFVQLDLASNASVRAAAEKIKSLTSTLDVLINCAGVMGMREFTSSADGVELHFAANHLGHFLLTKLLVDELAKAKGKVVNVSSMGYALSECEVDDINYDKKPYAPWPAYASSKTANILFSMALAEKFKSKGITALAADPGAAFGTQLQANQGMDEALLMEGMHLAQARNVTHDGIVTIPQGSGALLMGVLGDYTAPSTEILHECRPVEVRAFAKDMEIAEKLWKLSEKLVGETFA